MIPLTFLSYGMEWTLLFTFLPHGTEWILLVVLGLLLFGRKLPGIARSLGQSVVEFKKGIKGVKDEVEEASNDSSGNKKLPTAGTGDARMIDVNASSPSTQPAPTQEPSSTGNAAS